jgi:hypothetical protein
MISPNMQILYGFIPWTPRNTYITPAPAPTPAPTPEPPPAPTKTTPTNRPPHPDDAKPEWLTLRTALMKILDGFPEAKKAIIAYLVKSTGLPASPVWATT